MAEVEADLEALLESGPKEIKSYISIVGFALAQRAIRSGSMKDLAEAAKGLVDLATAESKLKENGGDDMVEALRALAAEEDVIRPPAGPKPLNEEELKHVDPSWAEPYRKRKDG